MLPEITLLQGIPTVGLKTDVTAGLPQEHPPAVPLSQVVEMAHLIMTQHLKAIHAVCKLVGMMSGPE